MHCCVVVCGVVCVFVCSLYFATTHHQQLQQVQHTFEVLILVDKVRPNIHTLSRS